MFTPSAFPDSHKETGYLNLTRSPKLSPPSPSSHPPSITRMRFGTDVDNYDIKVNGRDRRILESVSIFDNSSSPPYTSPTLSSKSTPSSLEQTPDGLSSNDSDAEAVLESRLRRSRGDAIEKNIKFDNTPFTTNKNVKIEKFNDDNSIDVAELLLASRRARSLHRPGVTDGISLSMNQTQNNNEGKIRSQSQSQKAEEKDVVNMGTTDKFIAAASSTNTGTGTGTGNFKNHADRGNYEDIKGSAWTPAITSPVGSEGSKRKSRTRTLDLSVQTQTMRSVSRSSIDLSSELQELADLSVRCVKSSLR